MCTIFHRVNKKSCANTQNQKKNNKKLPCEVRHTGFPSEKMGVPNLVQHPYFFDGKPGCRTFGVSV